MSQTSQKQGSLVSRESQHRDCLSLPCGDAIAPAAGDLGSVHSVKEAGEWRGTLESMWGHGGDPPELEADGSGRLAFL